MIPICDDCSTILTAEEAYYYERRCEDCERAWSERIERWRAGGQDEELDALFNEPFG